MPIKETIRFCKCKYCDKKLMVFVNSNGELVFFPEKNARPALAYYEMADHLKADHRPRYDLYSLASKFRSFVEDCYDIL